jgi:RimJ/RimL family protein N-acetyltransferase
MSEMGGLRHLVTDRLDLRAVDQADLDGLRRINADPGTGQYIPGGRPESREVTRRWIDRSAARWSADGRLLDGPAAGRRGGDRARRRPAPARASGTCITASAPAYWGHGYATELVRAAQRASLAVDPDLPLVAWIHAGNAASRAIAARAGLTDYGFGEAGHWKGEPMHCYADREPAFGQGTP